jgi:hypothetical protein
MAASKADKPQEKIKKQRAVELIVEEQGWDVPAAQIRDLVQSRYGLDMSIDHVQAARGKLRKKQAGNAKPPARKKKTRKGKPRAAASPRSEQPVASAGPRKEAGVPLHDILYIKELVGRFGAEPMHTFIDAFAK